MLLLLMVLVWACRDRDASPVAEETQEQVFMEWEENDTMILAKMPPGLSAWIGYFQAMDTGFRMGNFRASGVVLHFGDMPDAIPNLAEDQWRGYFLYSPDSSRYLDLFSYDHFFDKGRPVEGEADQQVVLADPAKGLRRQLMYNGPGQYADVADWLGNDRFIIGSRVYSEDGTTFRPNIMAFRLTDSTFTNFELDHTIPLEPIRKVKTGFGETYFNIIKPQ